MAERKPKEQAQLEAYLRAKRNYDKKMSDIDWNYEEYVPILEDYKAGRLTIDISQPLFALEMARNDSKNN